MEFKEERHDREYPDHACGRLIKDVAIDSIEPLTFREACNKIIHANKFLATFIKSGEVKIFCNEMEPMHHEMRLFGEHFGKEWRAELDVLAFLRATTENFDLF
ncbi:hypothetical protein [Thioclava indica]|uniref:hypothetical protein n=1 Tax=Thioclava indica TaxID=1353528 RepID=UPI0012DE5C99|nr:hypothetical protein [Thioclava indica]